MKLLADIGGTHARFALAEGDVIHEPVKYCARDFESLEAALLRFCSDQACTQKPSLLIATAARQYEDGCYRFVNNNSWVIDRDDLEKKGWSASLIVNDFVASARGALALPDQQKQVLKAGKPDRDTPCCILGPGTGLGLAYMHYRNDRWSIQKTAGGHMLAAAVSDEQWSVIKLVQRLKPNDFLLSFEDLVSGRALPVLYEAVCLYNGRESDVEKAADILAQDPESPCVKQTLRLFHEFFGLFAHNVIVTAHAYGGLFLDGGVLHRLREKNLFDFKTFEKFMMLTPLPFIQNHFDHLPVTIVNDPFVALRGVLELNKDEH